VTDLLVQAVNNLPPFPTDPVVVKVDNLLAQHGALTSAETVVSSVIGTVLDWLYTDEAEIELAQELLRDRAGDTDLSAARLQVRAVLEVLERSLEQQIGVDW
jgi:uncharacterized protein (DUF2267 family)